MVVQIIKNNTKSMSLTIPPGIIQETFGDDPNIILITIAHSRKIVITPLRMSSDFESQVRNFCNLFDMDYGAVHSELIYMKNKKLTFPPKILQKISVTPNDFVVAINNEGECSLPVLVIQFVSLDSCLTDSIMLGLAQTK
jgi:hypothetical protein